MLLFRTSLLGTVEVTTPAGPGERLVVVLPEDVVGDVGLLGAGARRCCMASRPLVLKANVLLMTFVTLAAFEPPASLISDAVDVADDPVVDDLGGQRGRRRSW